MFVELMPLIENRSVTVTISKLTGTDRIRVNFIPKELATVRTVPGYDAEAKAVTTQLETAAAALNSPLSITGTAAEIDAGLPRVLVEYVDGLAQLACSLDVVQQDLAAAHKLVEEAKKSKVAVKAAKVVETAHKAKAPVPAEEDQKRSAPAPAAFTLFATADEANRAAARPDVPGMPVAASANDAAPASAAEVQ